MRYEYKISIGKLGGTESCTTASCCKSFIFTSYLAVSHATCVKTLKLTFLHTTRKRNHTAPQTYDTWAHERGYNLELHSLTEVLQFSASVSKRLMMRPVETCSASVIYIQNEF